MNNYWELGIHKIISWELGNNPFISWDLGKGLFVGNWETNFNNSREMQIKLCLLQYIKTDSAD